MVRFFFPLLFLVPEPQDAMTRGPFGLLPRKWEVSIFDLYSLAAEKHPIGVPVELMQIFLQRVNMEISIEAADTKTAFRLVDTLRAMLYVRGVAPTLAPFATSYSLNAYAGINARTSGLTQSMHEGLREGITAKDTKIEGWPNELSLQCLRGDVNQLTNALSPADFVAAADLAVDWQRIEESSPSARTLRSALAKAPLMPDLSSSIMHMWQALENIFGIDREVTYRTSLLLAELCAPSDARLTPYNLAKKSYADRSKIAHGSNTPVDMAQWMRAWGLLRNAAAAVSRRGCIPTASALQEEMLAR